MMKTSMRVLAAAAAFAMGTMHAYAVDATFTLSNGSNAGPADLEFSYHIFVDGKPVCDIIWNENSCTGSVAGSGAAPGLAHYLVQVYWGEGRYLPTDRTHINTLAFWATFAATPNQISIPVSNVTFTLSGGNPYPDSWNIYLRSSGEIESNGPLSRMVNPYSDISHRVNYLQYARYSVTQPVLAGCYSVGMRRANAPTTGEYAKIGQTNENKVVCVGQNSNVSVDFNFAPGGALTITP